MTLLSVDLYAKPFIFVCLSWEQGRSLPEGVIRSLVGFWLLRSQTGLTHLHPGGETPDTEEVFVSEGGGKKKQNKKPACRHLASIFYLMTSARLVYSLSDYLIDTVDLLVIGFESSLASLRDNSCVGWKTCWTIMQVSFNVYPIISLKSLQSLELNLSFKMKYKNEELTVVNTFYTVSMQEKQWSSTKARTAFDVRNMNMKSIAVTRNQQNHKSS